MVADQSIQDWLDWDSWFTSSHPHGQAYVFMHELGHCLGLGHPTGNDAGSGNKGTTIITCIYSGLFSVIDYSTSNSNGRAADSTDPYTEIDVTDEWDAIDLSWGLIN